MKTCSVCKIEKCDVDFYIRVDRVGKVTSACKICTSQRRKKRRQLTGEVTRKYFRNYCVRRRKENPSIRVLHSLRVRINQVLHGLSKSTNTLNLLGCTVLEWRQWLEFQFQDGMTWENYGQVWEIDHVLPCASFDLSLPEQQKECFHFANTQPLFVLDNTRKGASVNFLP